MRADLRDHKQPSYTTPRNPRAASLTASDGAATPGNDDDVRPDDVLDVRATAQLLRLGRNTIYEMVARNQIPHRRFGRRIRFSRSAIMRWLDSWSLQGAKEGQ